MMVFAMLCAIAGYVTVSLFDRYEHNMDKLLHRGAFRKEDDPSVERPLKNWRSLGMGPEFSRFDRILYMATMVWVLGWWIVFLLGTLLHVTIGISDSTWGTFWRVNIWISVALGILTTVWFLCGGYQDIRQLLKDLKENRTNEADDGRVQEGQNLEDIVS